ncbi:MAG TPA: NUDIX hydrolase [Gaiellaceae bacterium]|jgi:8-oxo-dGTP diphosphatase
MAEVRAAGGVVSRRGDDGAVEVLLVHRPKYDDWSLPKGKCSPEEADLACALREVEEETGYVCETGEELPSTAYVDAKGRSKVVRYWAMRVQSGSFEPHEEVDEIRWLALDEAERLLTYGRDRALLADPAVRASVG